MKDKMIADILGNDRVVEHFGMEVVSCEDGKAVVSMRLADKHLNGFNTVQGGAVFALADVACAAAANTRGRAVTATASVSFLKAAKAGVLTASATEVSLSNRLGTYDCLVRDDEGTAIALVQVTCYRLVAS
jgi:acyl-CoA thioesterase